MTKRWGFAKHDYDAARVHRKDFRALLQERYGSSDFTPHELVFGELVANAIRHGDDPIEAVVIFNADRTVELDVKNAGRCREGQCFRPDLSRISRPAPTATGGRGLEIVRALADTFEIEHLPSHVCRVKVTMKV